MSSSRKGGTVADGDGDCIDSTMAAPVEQTSGRELQEAAHLAAMAEVLEASPGQGIFVQTNGKGTQLFFSLDLAVYFSFILVAVIM